MKRPLKKALAFVTACAFAAVFGAVGTTAATEHQQAHYAVNRIANNYNAFINTPNATLLISGAHQDPATTQVTGTLAATELLQSSSVMDMVTSTGEVIRINNTIGFTKFAGISSGELWSVWDWKQADNNAGYTLLNSEHIIVMTGSNKLALLLNDGTFYKNGALYDNVSFDANGFWFFTTGRVVTVCSPSMVAVASKTYDSIDNEQLKLLRTTQYGDYYQVFDDYYSLEGVPAPLGYTPGPPGPVVVVPEDPALATNITATYTLDSGEQVAVNLGTNWTNARVVSGLQNVTFFDGDDQPIVTVDSFTGSVFTENYLVAYGMDGLASINLDSETLKVTSTGSFMTGEVIAPADDTVVLERGEYYEHNAAYGSYTVASKTDTYRLYCAEMGVALSTSYSSFELGTDSSNGTIYIVKDSSNYQGILNKRGFTLVEPGEYAGIAYLENDMTIFKSNVDTSFTIINTTNGRAVSQNVYINYLLPAAVESQNDRYYWLNQPFIRPSTDGGVRVLPYYRHRNGNYSFITTDINSTEYILLFLQKQ